jgi:hypothetical protein
MAGGPRIYNWAVGKFGEAFEKQYGDVLRDVEALTYQGRSPGSAGVAAKV